MDEINYYKFAEFLEKNIDQNIETKPLRKAGTSLLSNWVGLFYYYHTSSTLTLNQIQKILPINIEKIFQIMSFLVKTGLVKKTLIKNEQDHILTYYSFSELFFRLKDEYVEQNETDWAGYEQWKSYYKTYQENIVFFDEIEYHLKLRIRHDSEHFEQAIRIKQKYISRISEEIDIDKRIKLKNLAIRKIDELID